MPWTLLFIDGTPEAPGVAEELEGASFEVVSVRSFAVAGDSIDPDVCIVRGTPEWLPGETQGIKASLRPDVPVLVLPLVRIRTTDRFQLLRLGADEVVEDPAPGEVAWRTKRALERQGAKRATERAAPAERDAEIERLNRLKDDFLVTLSHELRTPMTVVLGWASVLVNGGLDRPYAEQAIEAIERNARRQLSLINSVLDVSDIVQGRLPLDIDQVDLLPLVSEVVESARPAAFARQIEIAWAPASEHLVIAGDAQRLRQVIWHLVSNAVRFTPTGGRVTVRATRGTEQAVIQVSDNGIGIDKGFLPHVFEPFRQADASTRREYGGLGLGLTLVRHLVELHGGQVAAASRGRGCGATFSVTLPLRAAVSAGEAESAPGTARAAQAGSRPGAAARPVSGQPRSRLDGVAVLVVGGDAETRESLESILIEGGARVEVAHTAGEAFDRLTAGLVAHVLVADVGLQGDDGYDLIRGVRALPAERGGRIPAVALTRHADFHERDYALAAGFQVQLPRPVSRAQLLDAVATLAGREVWS